MWHHGESVYYIREREVPIARRIEAWKAWKKRRGHDPEKPATFETRADGLNLKHPPNSDGFEPHEIQMGALIEETEELRRAVKDRKTKDEDEAAVIKCGINILDDLAISYRERIRAVEKLRLWLGIRCTNGIAKWRGRRKAMRKRV